MGFLNLPLCRRRQMTRGSRRSPSRFVMCNAFKASASSSAFCAAAAIAGGRPAVLAPEQFCRALRLYIPSALSVRVGFLASF